MVPPSLKQKDGVEENGGSVKGEADEALASLSWFCGRVSSQHLISVG